MINKEKMKILSVRSIAHQTIEMVLESEQISKVALPGQFLHIQVGNLTLRRPISIANNCSETGRITILFKVNGQGTNELSSYQSGEMLDILGPLGNGFPLESRSESTVLLIGGGIGVPPLYYLGKTFRCKGIKVISILGFQQANDVFYEDQFSELGETIIVTNDGSYGFKGLVTDVLERISAFDCYYACGPKPMLKALTDKLTDKEGFISLEERMGCGVGACFACVLPTTDGNGYKKICKDGPVFPAREVKL
ncbi:dihydroorotate dehydrogenase electron transfer subunit [Ornithinibacillus scapharcae]|uniref:dihydroorotate dehydrogenase electron transfer subunit n=1 Tax=Ornithinibacillus scapharcae TaxID=1147159 RepID=UPI000225BE1C|nr:dihydroorotate dehydrogenase electron transfer subunit [Ornithinibacillus scapharcae]